MTNQFHRRCPKKERRSCRDTNKLDRKKYSQNYFKDIRKKIYCNKDTKEKYSRKRNHVDNRAIVSLASVKDEERVLDESGVHNFNSDECEGMSVCSTSSGYSSGESSPYSKYYSRHTGNFNGFRMCERCGCFCNVCGIHVTTGQRFPYARWTRRRVRYFLNSRF